MFIFDISIKNIVRTLLINHKRKLVMNWIFDGLGTEIISIIFGLIFGGACGYRIGIKKNIKQKQIANDNANQVQISNIYGEAKSKSRK